MSDNFNKPERMSFDHAAENWSKWRQKMELYLLASGKAEEEDDIKIATMLNFMGDEGLEIFNSFNVSIDKAKFEEVLNLFESHCIPKRNEVVESFKFHNLKQHTGQQVENFVVELKKQAGLCEFNCVHCKKSYQERMIKDRLILGVNNTELQMKLLKEKKLNLEEIIEVCRVAETTKLQSAEIKKERLEAVDSTIIEQRKQYKNCSRCGYKHVENRCFAYGKTCVKCGKIGHFANVCKGVSSFQQRTQQRNDRKMVAHIESMDDRDTTSVRQSEATEEPVVHVLTADVKSSYKLDNLESGINDNWTGDIKIGNVKINIKLDTGAQASVLPLHIFRKLRIDEKEIRPTKVRIIAYGNFEIISMGIIELYCNVNNNTRLIEFIIVKENLQPLLGLRACNELKLIKRVCFFKYFMPPNKEALIERYKNVFSGFGSVSGYKYKIELRSEAIPVIQQRKRIPFSMIPKLKETILSLERDKIISKVDYPTDWVNQLIIVEKQGG